MEACAQLIALSFCLQDGDDLFTITMDVTLLHSECLSSQTSHCAETQDRTGRMNEGNTLQVERWRCEREKERRG